MAVSFPSQDRDDDSKQDGREEGTGIDEPGLAKERPSRPAGRVEVEDVCKRDSLQGETTDS